MGPQLSIVLVVLEYPVYKLKIFAFGQNYRGATWFLFITIEKAPLFYRLMKLNNVAILFFYVKHINTTIFTVWS